MSSNAQTMDHSVVLQEQVKAALGAGTPLVITGNCTKEFYGHRVQGRRLETTVHTGVVDYDPSELVVTVRAGTPLVQLEQLLDENGQMLAFEPSSFGGRASVGGTIACNVSGPRRMVLGAARDFVLGCRVINGNGELLHFGGKVIKNVAGYDVSRLMTGAQGTLGLLLEVSLKVLPKPEAEMTLAYEMGVEESITMLHRWLQQPYPLSASCFDERTLWIRLSGSSAALAHTHRRLGGQAVSDSEAFWRCLNDKQHEFFGDTGPLWRLSLPSDCKPLALPGKWLYEWNGALRWLRSTASADAVRRQVEAVAGHAMYYRGDRQRIDTVLHPLDPRLVPIHRRLKQAFDPERIFNPGRLYPDL